MKKIFLILICLFIRSNALITGGTYTYGVGGNYATRTLAYADAGGAVLTSDLIFVQISKITGSTGSSLALTLNGFNVIDSSLSPPNGDPTAGYLDSITYSSDGYIRPTLVGIGSYSLYGHRFKYMNNTGGFAALFYSGAANTGIQINIHDNIFIGNGYGQWAFYPAQATLILNVWNNYIDNFDIGIFLSAISTSSVFEGNTILNSRSYGFKCNSKAITLKNNVVALSATADYNLVGSATGRNNASSDATATNANWGTGTGNVPSITAANEFFSTTITSPSYAMSKGGASCATGGLTTTLLSGDTTGIRKNSRPGPDAAVSIGADEFLTPVTVSSITPTSGFTLGGDSVVIVGSGFVGTTNAIIGSAALSGPHVYSSTHLGGRTGAQAVGTYDVSVTNGDCQIGTLTNSFIISDSLIKDTVSLTNGDTAAYRYVRLTGPHPVLSFAAGSKPGFLAGATITFDSCASVSTLINNSGRTLPPVWYPALASIASVKAKDTVGVNSTHTRGPSAPCSPADSYSVSSAITGYAFNHSNGTWTATGASLAVGTYIRTVTGYNNPGGANTATVQDTLTVFAAPTKGRRGNRHKMGLGLSL